MMVPDDEIGTVVFCVISGVMIVLETSSNARRCDDDRTIANIVRLRIEITLENFVTTPPRGNDDGTDLMNPNMEYWTLLMIEM